MEGHTVCVEGSRLETTAGCYIAVPRLNVTVLSLKVSNSCLNPTRSLSDDTSSFIVNRFLF